MSDNPPSYSQTQSSTYVPQPVIPAPVYIDSEPTARQTATTFRYSPCSIKCQNCRAEVLTHLEYKAGGLTWIICGILCLFGVWCGCQFIPFCIDDCKDIKHICPNCNALLGVYRRF